MAGARRDDLLDTEAVEFALAVSEALGFDSHAVEHGHEQIRHRSSRGIADMAAALDLPVGSSGEDEREVRMAMEVSV